jgi:CHAT domain-containing protein/restriction endonuclease
MLVTRDDLQSLTPDAFERLIAQLLVASGFRNVVGLGGSGDEGIDLRGEWLEELPTGDTRLTVWAVQCKRYSSSLSQQQIRDVLNAALEPPLDLLPARPDFFLIATSSSLSPNSRRIVERANNDRAKYGCMFVVWDGDSIASRLSHHASITEQFFRPPAPPPSQPRLYPLIRLSIVMDKVADRVFLTFLCDLEEGGPVSLMGRSELQDQDFAELLRRAKSLADQLVYPGFDKDKEDLLKATGRQIAALIPPPIRSALFNHDPAYVRLASNTQEIPFELAYDEDCDRFLGTDLRIGRIQISDTARPATRRPGPSVLLIGPGTSADHPPLPMAEKEIRELSAILSADGIPVTTLSGDQATRHNLAKLLQNKDYGIIHFSGHGIAESGGLNGLLLADGVISFDEILSRPVNGSLVFLSACGSGTQLHDTSQHLFQRGVSSVLGFVGPVTDEAANCIAVKFYDELRCGASLGDALHAARQYQRAQMREDFSWVSSVLFGDPTSIFTGDPPTNDGGER